MSRRAHRTIPTSLLRGLPLILAVLACLPSAVQAQRDGRPAPAVQGFDPVECRDGCVIDTLVIDLDRSRRNQPPTATLTLVLLDTVALPRRGAPPAPKERPVSAWIACDSSPCGAANIPARLSDRRIDDARVLRRTQAAWPMSLPLVRALLETPDIVIVTSGRRHRLTSETRAAMASVLEPLKAGAQAAAFSPRMQLYIASFAAFGMPGDSVLAEDVGTASEPLMMPATDTVPPTRVATVTSVGRGAGAATLLVQDDATGAAPLFGVNESVAIALPARVGRRAVITGKVLARQRVEMLRDSCEGMKIWTYLVALPAADREQLQRGALPSPRPGDLVDRWNGTAVREPYPARMTPAEQRAITASRTVVAQFVKERAREGIRAQDVQVLAALPRGAGFVTNFGVIAKAGPGWRFPTLDLRPTSCR